MNRLKIGMEFFILLGLAAVAHTQSYDLRSHPEVATTDDPRRVPIPTPDRSREPVIVLQGGTLIDGTGAAPIPNAVMVMQGDRIVSVGPTGRVQLPDRTDETIDVGGLYVVPGLIDLHLHFTQQRGEDFGRYRDSDVAAAIRGVALLGQLLDGGITAVRDAGTSNDVAIRIKEAVERRIFPGPRVFTSGALIASRGGHSDEITQTASGRPRSLDSSARTRVATGPDEWRLAVREQIRMGADWIKLTAPYTREEVAAAVDEAHLHGIRVMADAFGEFVDWGVEAGLDSIEHPLAISDEAVKKMAARGTAFVPTLTAFYNVFTYGYPSAGIPAGGFYYTMSRRFFFNHQTNLRTVRLARETGVKIGVGTDIPFENEKRYPADYFVELGFLKDAGFTAPQILTAATRVSAEILDMGDKLGTLEAGKIADVLVVRGNPLEDHANLKNLVLLVADGRVVRDRRKAR
jgi:imidazolonepropionase-like amidohydrolase